MTLSATLDSLDRFEEELAAGGDNSAYKKKRNWDQQQKLRSEANGWLGELDGMGDDYRAALWGVLNDEPETTWAQSPSGWTRAESDGPCGHLQPHGHRACA